jgi:hypothetical protein
VRNGNAPWVAMLQELDGVVDVAALECSYFAEWAERDAFSEMPQNAPRIGRAWSARSGSST